jgi:hypothetical protein
LDYHQDSVQVCVLDKEGRQLLNRACDNNWQRIVEAVRPLGVVKRAAIEACCGAADLGEERVAPRRLASGACPSAVGGAAQEVAGQD